MDDQESQVSIWSVDDVQDWLAQHGFTEYADIFAFEGVDGPALLNLTTEALHEYGIEPVERLEDLDGCIRALQDDWQQRSEALDWQPETPQGSISIPALPQKRLAPSVSTPLSAKAGPKPPATQPPRSLRPSGIVEAEEPAEKRARLTPSNKAPATPGKAPSAKGPISKAPVGKAPSSQGPSGKAPITQIGRSSSSTPPSAKMPTGKLPGPNAPITPPPKSQIGAAQAAPANGGKSAKSAGLYATTPTTPAPGKAVLPSPRPSVPKDSQNGGVAVAERPSVLLRQNQARLGQTAHAAKSAAAKAASQAKLAAIESQAEAALAKVPKQALPKMTAARSAAAISFNVADGPRPPPGPPPRADEEDELEADTYAEEEMFEDQGEGYEEEAYDEEEAYGEEGMEEPEAEEAEEEPEEPEEDEHMPVGAGTVLVVDGLDVAQTVATNQGENVLLDAPDVCKEVLTVFQWLCGSQPESQMQVFLPSQLFKSWDSQGCLSTQPDVQLFRRSVTPVPGENVGGMLLQYITRKLKDGMLVTLLSNQSYDSMARDPEVAKVCRAALSYCITPDGEFLCSDLPEPTPEFFEPTVPAVPNAKLPSSKHLKPNATKAPAVGGFRPTPTSQAAPPKLPPPKQAAKSPGLGQLAKGGVATSRMPSAAPKLAVRPLVAPNTDSGNGPAPKWGRR